MSVNVLALKELKRVVMGIPLDKLDLRTYGMSKYITTDVADMAAWAARDPWFRGKGFAMEDYAAPQSNRAYPKYGDAIGNHATRAFFKLDAAQNEYLFGEYLDDPHPLAAVLLDRIEAVIRGKMPVAVVVPINV
jgi:hypothetical protein